MKKYRFWLMILGALFHGQLTPRQKYPQRMLWKWKTAHFVEARKQRVRARARDTELKTGCALQKHAPTDLLPTTESQFQITQSVINSLIL